MSLDYSLQELRLLAGRFASVSTWPLVLLIVKALLTLAAAWIPAPRVAALDPLHALTTE